MSTKCSLRTTTANQNAGIGEGAQRSPTSAFVCLENRIILSVSIGFIRAFARALSRSRRISLVYFAFQL